MTCAPEQSEARRERNRQRERRRTRLRRAIVLAHYGGECECCGETRVKLLQIDHVGGGGADHRRFLEATRGISGQRIYQYLIIEGFPEGFRVLCVSCNWATGAADHGACCCRELPTLAKALQEFTRQELEDEIAAMQRRGANATALVVPKPRARPQLRHGRWSQAEIATLRDLLYSGATVQEASAHLNRSLSSTQRYAHILGDRDD